MPRPPSSQEGSISGTFIPAAGVRSDFEKLLTAFANLSSVRYEEFAKLWRERKMSLIFAGRQNDVECREFTEECLRIATEFWMAPFNFQARVGGFYLLYGLFTKQIFDPKVKIRLTSEQWGHVMEFMDQVQAQQHLDIEFIFRKLVFEKAFLFVAAVSEIYPQMGQRPFEEKTASKFENLKEDKSVLSEIFEPEKIDQLSMVHDMYHRMKCALADDGATTPPSSLNVIQSNLVQFITKVVTTHEEWRKFKANKKGPRKRRDSRDSAPTTSESDSDVEQSLVASPAKTGNIGDRRAELREKAFSALSVASRSRRHRQATKADDSSSTLSPSPVKRLKTTDSRDKTTTAEGLTVIGTITGFDTHVRNTLMNMPPFSASSDTGDDKYRASSSKKTRKPKGLGKGKPVQQKTGQKKTKSEKNMKPPKKRGRKKKQLTENFCGEAAIDIQQISFPDPAEPINPSKSTKRKSLSKPTDPDNSSKAGKKKSPLDPTQPSTSTRGGKKKSVLDPSEPSTSSRGGKKKPGGSAEAGKMKSESLDSCSTAKGRKRKSISEHMDPGTSANDNNKKAFSDPPDTGSSAKGGKSKYPTNPTQPGRSGGEKNTLSGTAKSNNATPRRGRGRPRKNSTQGSKISATNKCTPGLTVAPTQETKDSTVDAFTVDTSARTHASRDTSQEVGHGIQSKKTPKYDNRTPEVNRSPGSSTLCKSDGSRKRKPFDKMTGASDPKISKKITRYRK